MPQPGEAFEPQPSAEDSFLDLLVETLDGLDESVRGQFLRQFFRTISQIDFTEVQSSEYWTRILERRRQLSDSLGKKVSLKTAMVDVLSSANILRVPILIEYDEFKKLQINAATDALTGLYNRRLFDEYCEKELNRAKRYGQQLAVVILDLHKLKEVNDRHGHLQGDRVLQIAATTLSKTLRASDFAFRIGGDEFALLLPQTDPEQAVTLCRRVRAQYESELRPLKLDVGVTLDFGVAVHPQDGDQKSDLLALADKRLYELKHSGRAASRVIPLETHPPREAAPAAPPPRAAAAAAAAVPAGPTVVPSPAPQSEQRKWERVSLAGTKAHAVLAEIGQTSTKVIDLSYGGVALQLESAEALSEQFNAVLHVPILPPVRVVLRKIYTVRMESGRMRVGCAFVS
ncbi:MAG TPA: GGDEF domain-containing protein [Candidatus Acidoferrales bacterium]|nr:GGDEF domain-containing protein [Candidatus Acidoferrales bacterium]